MNKIILASGSPRRKQILELAHIDFEIKVIPTSEEYPAGIKPSEIAIYIAKNKALAVRDSLSTLETIVAADTIVLIEGKVLGKPADREEAIDMLTLLSGKTHQVITGVYVSKGEKEFTFHSITDVTFKNLNQEQISYYIDTCKPFDKAGSYAIQEWIGVIGIESINGDYYNVLGLPLNKLLDILHIIEE